ncbi:MAG: PadR family transcriptional regulator [Lachnotalea sp.]
MNQRYEQQMKKGVFEMLVLRLLESEEMYGYQLINELKIKSNGLFILKEGTLYPILYRLEDDGMVFSRWSQPKEKEVSRKYYVITESGRATLIEMNQLWSDFSKHITLIMEGNNE